MKNLLISTVLLFGFGNVNAQKIQEIASKNIDQAIPLFDQISDFKNTDEVKLVGLGDVGEYVKESKKLNTAFSAYLISKKKFRNIVLQTDNWLLQPLNAYLTSSAPADSAVFIPLFINAIPARGQFANTDFMSLLTWIKKYNLAHPQDMVNIFGVAPNKIIPPSYFLSTYVFAVDQPYGKKLSEKWSESIAPDSIAYSDIKIWVESLKNKKLSKMQQDLVSSCNEDLLHNTLVVQIVSVDQRIPPRYLNERSRYVANQILKKLGKKTIFYALNTEVAKADLKWSFSLDNHPFFSTGKYLGEDLKENYYVFITDFADIARIPVVSYSAKKINVEVLSGPEQAKTLYKKNDYFDRKKDSDLLKGYQPILLSTSKEIITNTVVDRDSYATDALFLFSQLSKIETNVHF
ncbi:erythromycin esterase family protein [Mucilaginibacter sp. UR6-11]|uniref:erythromycin esterase family protein n=1 Tax=Mucilaginibacter sp. UR6-11 TaxID=1435644 RepID=UPI001E4576EB|nr:erythromycin esterase family protein [Mucilaginibacter sp. UR6-11]MCC8427015.1 erythromycin esterase family protein [Mucilaginibacter sp. UR6-11]